ncbi:E3 ubiquitin-protein ligase Mdm2 isoform X1 [Octopus vulgaris]|uniref:E3 ubiquitin-protein ligase Mdm2 isoform X1 n=2 Tax=Octopus TaxID=6643 RepID=A0AA36BLU7_OCTVU|nr:E3 ubiquitin-protein ligase Mdm2 isoform X1 [Octopus sinensis]CAI9736801.1 E3 ubiquitin-protein ligase Mdm2 isoform X1 [Octopus vulgaris]
MPGVAKSTRSVGIGVNLLPRAIITSYYVKDLCGVMENHLADDHQKLLPAEGSSVSTPTAETASQQRLLPTDGSSVTSSAVSDSQQRLLPVEGSSVSTTTSGAASSAEKPNSTKLYPKPEFLKLLQSVGATGKAFSMSEIIRYLKKYISSHMLYDPLKPWLVHCSNDKLGKVFRRNHFTVVDVRGLLYQNVTFSNKSNSFNSNEEDSCDSDATEILDVSKSDSEHTSPQMMLPRDDVITSSTSEPVNLGQNSSPLYSVKPSFLEILHVAGAKGYMFTEKEIFRYLKHYIWSRKLFDPEQPWIFLCRNDRLADVFKLEKFIIYDVPSLIAKYGIESPEYRPKLTKRLNSEELKEMLDTNSRLTSHSSAPGQMQSTPSDITSSTSETTTTQTSSSLLEESLRASTSCSPSTSFTLTLEVNNENEVLSIESEDPVEDVYVEYEVMSNTSSVQASDSEDEQPQVAMDMLVICQDSDMEFWADLSENGSDSDVELSEADKWCCSKCHAYNSPIHRLCDICWTIRPGWLPNYDSQKNSNEDTESTDELTNCGESGVNVKTEKSSTSDDYPIDKVCQIRNTLSNICYYSETDIPARRTRNQTGSRKRRLTSESEESDISGKIRRLTSPEKLPTPGVCLICSQNPRDASLIHGTSGHQICCLTCAKKLKRKGHKCPICRRTIQKVVRNYLT